MITKRGLGIALLGGIGLAALPNRLLLPIRPAFAAGIAGPILPSSIYLGGAAGNLSSTFYIPTTNTNTAGAFEGIGVVASLAADAPAVLQFNMPELIPAGTLKLRCLAMANATAGTAKLDIADGATSAGSNIGATTLTTEAGSPTISQTWTTADVLVENKVTLTTAPTFNQILTVLATFRTASWTLAAASTWQFSLVYE